MPRPVLATLFAGAGLGLLSILSMLSLIGNFVADRSLFMVLIPWSDLFVIPLFMGIPFLLIAFLVPVMFWMWSWFLFRGRATVPLRTVVALPIVAVLSFVHHVTGWHDAMSCLGLGLTVSYTTLNLLIIIAFIISLVRGRHELSFSRNLLLHTSLFGWMIIYCFVNMNDWP